MTKRESFEMIMEIAKGLANEKEIVEFCEKEIANLAKKSASNEARKARKAEEFADIEKAIMKVFTDVNSATPKEIAEEIGLSTQKVNPRLMALAERGALRRSTEKKNVFYTLVEMPSEWAEEFAEEVAD